MTEDEAKQKFARLTVKDKDYFKVALTIYPDDTTAALKAAHLWPNDPYVIEYQEKLLEGDGALAFQPDKAELCKSIWEKMNARFTNTEDFTKLAKLYADIRGFIPKAETIVNNNTNVENKVMVVRDLGSDDEWEQKAMKQQRDLLNVATSKH